MTGLGRHDQGMVSPLEAQKTGGGVGVIVSGTIGEIFRFTDGMLVLR